MAEDRMLNDEILLGLIKANSGGGGGGTTDYEDLDNLPKVNNVELKGNKSLSDLGIASAQSVANITNGESINNFAGVETALSGKQAILTFDDTPTQNSTNPVKSGGVYSALAEKQNTLTAGDYIDIISGEISVNREIPANNFTYEIVTKSIGGSDASVTVKKYANGSLVSSTDYLYTSVSTAVNIDGYLTLQYTGGWKYTLLQASTDHASGYVQTWGYETVVDYTEEFPTEDTSGLTLVIKSEMDTALAGKVDKVNGKGLSTNDYDNTEKAQVATNAEDISSLMSGLTTLDNEVNGDATTYSYADVITIEDAVPANLADCSVKIEPVQDLHGYSQPWVGGAGKNKVWCTREIGTKSHLGGSIITYADGTVELDGTFSENFTLIYNDSLTLPSGSYKLNGGITYCSMTVTNVGNAYNTEEYAFTLNADYSGSLTAYITARQYNHAILKPMIRLSTETDATFAPYTNICPISGHTEAKVQRVGKNILDMSTFKRVSMNDGSASNNWITFDQMIPCNGENAFYFSSSTDKTIYRFVINLYDDNKTLLTQKFIEYVNVSGFSFTIDNANAAYFKCGYYHGSSIADVSFTDAQIEAGTAKTPYEPYQGKTYTIALGDTIYGGKVRIDSNGNTVMDVDMAIVTVDETTPYTIITANAGVQFSYENLLVNGVGRNVLCNEFNTQTASGWNELADNNIMVHPSVYTNFRIRHDACDTGEKWESFLAENNVQVCYNITPFTVQLTPQQIQLLKGTNTLTASTGQISVTANGVSGAIGSVQEQVNDNTSAVEDLQSDVAELQSGVSNNYINLALNNLITLTNDAPEGTHIDEAKIRFDDRFCEIVLAFNNNSGLTIGETNPIASINWSNIGISFDGAKSYIGTANNNPLYPDWGDGSSFSFWRLNSDSDTNNVTVRVSDATVKAVRLCTVFKLSW